MRIYNIIYLRPLMWNGKELEVEDVLLRQNENQNMRIYAGIRSEVIEKYSKKLVGEFRNNVSEK